MIAKKFFLLFSLFAVALLSLSTIPKWVVGGQIMDLGNTAVTGAILSPLSITVSSSMTVTSSSTECLNVDSADSTLVVDCLNNVVGIGASAPTNRELYISSPGPAITLKSETSGEDFSFVKSQTAGGGITWQNNLGSANLGAFLDNGNVGIGMTTPAHLLSVNGNAQLVGTATGSRTLGFGTDDGISGWSIGNGIIDATHNFRIYDNTNAAARVTINGSGNVGIGTASPDTNLEISKSANSVSAKVTNANASTSLVAVSSMTLEITNSVGYVQGGMFLRETSVDGGSADLALGSGHISNGPQSEDLTISGANGNVGIGTTAPAETLDVAGGIGHYSRTKAQLEAITPGKAGTAYYCSDCLNAVNMVISTGATISGFDSFGIGGTVWH